MVESRVCLWLVLVVVSGWWLAAPTLASEDKYLIAGTGESISKAEAMRLLAEDGFKMTQIKDGSELLSLLYVEASELAGHLPDHLVQVMADKDAGVDPGAKWIGQKAPEFALVDLSGAPVDSKDLAGRVRVLNFWFISCLPCVHEMPALSRLEQRYPDRGDIVFLAITFDAPSAVSRFLKDREFTYRQLTAPRSWFSAVGINAFPTHLVVDREGVVTGAVEGLDDPRALEQELERRIEEAR